MRIGFVVTVLGSPPGFENIVSAHVQLPCDTMRLLQDAGHEIELITNGIGPDRRLPACLPDGVPLHQVTDARPRAEDMRRWVRNSRRIRPLRLLRQLRQIKELSERRRYDVLHLFGSTRMVHLAGALRLVGLRAPTMVTVMSIGPEPPEVLSRPLWRRVSGVVTATEFVRNRCLAQGVDAEVIPHGVGRDLKKELAGTPTEAPHRVLFWRNPFPPDGADVALEVFDLLAPRYPDVSFDLAVRPHPEALRGIEELPRVHSNVHSHHAPYGDGISLAKLVAESICILLPFRELSTHPQYAVVESMLAGRAVITTPVGSNPELIRPGDDGILVPEGNATEAAAAVEGLLREPDAAAEIGKRAEQSVRTRWNWEQYPRRLLARYEELAT